MRRAFAVIVMMLLLSVPQFAGGRNFAEPSASPASTATDEEAPSHAIGADDARPQMLSIPSSPYPKSMQATETEDHGFDRESWLAEAVASCDGEAEVVLSRDAWPNLRSLPPIRIDGDADMDAEHGVASGNGTLANPWVIDGLEVNGTGAGCAIYVGNVTGHFIVAGCVLHHSGGRGWWPYHPNIGLYLFKCPNATVSGNWLHSNEWKGLCLYLSENATVEGNEVTDNLEAGISLYEADYTTVEGNLLERNAAIAIELIYTNHSRVLDNTARLCDEGVRVDRSILDEVAGNTVELCVDGLVAIIAEDVSFRNNTVDASPISALTINWCGSVSSDGDIFTGCGIFLYGSQSWQWNSHDLRETTTVNGRPLRYVSGIIGYEAPAETGQLILVDCAFSVAFNLSLDDASFCAMLAYCVNVTLGNISASDAYCGLYIYQSDGCVVSGLTCDRNSWCGMCAEFSGSMRIDGGSYSGSGSTGVFLAACYDTATTGCNASGNARMGVHLRNADSCLVESCLMWDDTAGLRVESGSDSNQAYGNVIGRCVSGIEVFSSLGNAFHDNSMAGCGFFFLGSTLAHWASNTVDGWADNRVNGLRVRMLEGQTGGVAPQEAGQMLLVQCQNVAVEGESYANATVGVTLAYSTDCVVAGCNLTGNAWAGAYVQSGSGNLFVNNLFSGNGYDAVDYGDSYWDAGYPEGGNCWTDHNATDFLRGWGQDILGSDGIGDWPCEVLGSEIGDRFPLMRPFWSRGPVHNVTLASGWSLVSYPAAESYTSSEVTLTAHPQVAAVQSWDRETGWSVYSRGVPWFANTLRSVDCAKGYWVLNDGAASYFWLYGEIPEHASIQLHAGWNLVGYPSSSTNLTVAQALAGLPWDIIQQSDTTRPYNLKAMPGTAQMEPGRGYWVHVAEDCTWVVPS